MKLKQVIQALQEAVGMLSRLEAFLGGGNMGAPDPEVVQRDPIPRKARVPRSSAKPAKVDRLKAIAARAVTKPRKVRAQVEEPEEDREDTDDDAEEAASEITTTRASRFRPKTAFMPSNRAGGRPPRRRGAPAQHAERLLHRCLACNAKVFSHKLGEHMATVHKRIVPVETVANCFGPGETPA